VPLIAPEARASVDAAGPADATEHTHGPARGIPVALPKEVLRELCTLQPWRTVRALAEEWVCIGVTVALAVLADHWLATAIAVVVVGARQHALAVLSHEAAHYRFLPSRRLNDLACELLVAWPVFVSGRFFRVPHAPHHQHLGEPGDGNRRAWRTHDAEGRIRPEWVYPKTPLGLAAKILRRAAGPTGALWIVRFFVAPIALGRPAPEVAAHFAYHGLLAAIVTAAGVWPEVLLYWLLPYVTWHVAAQYVRLICEHSGRISDHPDYAGTRSTHPGPLGRFLILPRNIGYHLEHHWFPGVPWYNLPALYEALRADDGFARHANVQTSISASLAQCLGKDNCAGSEDARIDRALAGHRDSSPHLPGRATVGRAPRRRHGDGNWRSSVRSRTNDN
jgi:fatty acid desaturase